MSDTWTAEKLAQSTAQPHPPAGLAPLVEALWWEAKGDWNRAHEIAQEIHTPNGAWVHAYLHRREGDQGNAGYWYRNVGRPVCTLPLDEEWKAITSMLLDAHRRP
ncbi:MAG: hypothetical protein ACP5M4_01755 [Acidobacteriaceae bacterium]